MNPKTKRIAVITGAGRGIGACIAKHFVEQGCLVYVTDFHGEDAELRAATLGEGARAKRMDVRHPKDVAHVMQTIRNEVGHIDILVNNAGVMTTGPALQTSYDTWTNLAATNLTGIFNCVQACAPAMCERSAGVIINLASISAYKGGGTFGNVWYGVTKAGVVAVTKGLARELGPHGVRVNAVAPSVVETEMVRAQLSPETRSQILPRFPMGRIANPDDVARAVVFLASGDASFITGETLAVDGGLLKV
ncbi:3-oxoacyl-[acyl-carrier-protein] reductase FabG [Ralstonia condita]|uniref:3-oxoacyl-[acyl-carrier-protein] reductase FabG n=1 Tax=Ralstonia condita TaxID=3058600 RepID=A0ABM9JDZ1_9RALS|nr:SDR family oxidoreductase [Ralstonia sp. LMG 7141]CAJ0790383.1 3-oxoacyl-[acyl-carrier-protein] reductase FabG [Ralstonia sp. LMG 7141]